MEALDQVASSVRVLLVEDNPGDAFLTKEALNESKILVHLDHVDDGFKALDYLYKRNKYKHVQEPDLILLDLNLPGKSGSEVLGEVKQDKHLRHIPVAMLTSSENEEDVLSSYGMGANCYVAKPVGLEEFAKIIRSLEEFWFSIVRLPFNSR
ncbi:MAG: response regulator [Calditrichia bacterium]